MKISASKSGAILLRLGLLFALGFAVACSHNPLTKKIAQPAYYLDNTLPFQPKRIWRLWVKWEPYLLDDKKAIVVKEFQHVVRDAKEQKRLEAEIQAHGGDKRYLRWLESELFPLGDWEKLEEARVARLQDMMIVVIVTRALKEVPQSGRLSVGPVVFPDPIFRGVADGCHDLNWDVLPVDDSVGTEIVLESRELDPGAEKWDLLQKDLPNFSWRAWSVGQERRMAYRTFVHVKNNISRCPLPPRVHEEFKAMAAKAQMTGVDW